MSSVNISSIPLKSCTVDSTTKNHDSSVSIAKCRPSKISFQIVLALLLIHFCDEVHVAGDTAGSPLRVASFNIRQFGVTKMSKANVSKAIVSIIKRYDLVYIMETRDKQEIALGRLKEQLGAPEWDYIASEPLGRSSYKEQHVFFYRPSVVTPHQNYYIYQFQSDLDDFEREPIVAQFEYLSSYADARVKVTFVGAHLDPDHVVSEMEALPGAIAAAQQLFRDSDAVVLMGDLNADCTYMNCAERENATLFSSPEVYTNLVPDKIDTTVSHTTHCAYDRVIVTVRDKPRVKVANVKPYNFEEDLNLSFDAAWNVSDHYPVEFTLD